MDDAPGAKPLIVKAGTISFEKVSFGYDHGEGSIPNLSNISFTIPAGKTTAIVGPTGSGKSTIVRLLLRFYDVDGGRICIDNQDIRDVKQQSLREAIGVGTGCHGCTVCGMAGPS